MSCKISSEDYHTIQELSKVLGFWMGSKFRKKLVGDGVWNHEEITNFKTIDLYNCTHSNVTYSLPVYNKTFSKVVIFDIDNNQNGNMTVSKAIEIIESYFGKGFYKEIKNMNPDKGAHVYIQFETEVFEEGRLFLQNYFFVKHNIKIEANLNILRLPYSKDYRRAAEDENGVTIDSVAHLLEVFTNKQETPAKIPAFLKCHNKHGSTLSRKSIYNSEIVFNDVTISRGNRCTSMITLALYAIGQNMTITDFAELCDSKDDPSNPSKDLSGTRREKIIGEMYSWAEKNYSSTYQHSDKSEKPKYYINEVEWQISNEDYDMANFMLNHNADIMRIKHEKKREERKLDAIVMYEEAKSKMVYHEENPDEGYKGQYAVLNEGIALDLKTVKLIAEKNHIKNWREVWKIVKEVFLEPIALANGYFYSYCNIRHAIHYKFSSIVSIFKSLMKKLYSKKPSVITSIYYNICRQVSCNINSQITKILKISHPRLRAGPT